MNENPAPPAEVPNPQVPPANPAPSAPVQAPAPPPAAQTVIDGSRSEREIELERTVEAERKRTADAEQRAKRAETDASYLADEARRLREAQGAPGKVRKTGTGWFQYEEGN